MIEVKKDTPQMKEADFGYTVQAIGPVIDVRFSEGKTPAIRTMLTVDMSSDSNDKKDPLVLEVAQDLGNDTVRCIAMGPTEGIKRNMKVVNTHGPIEFLSVLRF